MSALEVDTIFQEVHMQSCNANLLVPQLRLIDSEPWAESCTNLVIIILRGVIIYVLT